MTLVINWDASEKKMYVGEYTFPLKEVTLSEITPAPESDCVGSNIAALKKAMVTGEKIPPPILLATGKRYRIYDGNHRYYAAISLLGKTGKISAYIIPKFRKYR